MSRQLLTQAPRQSFTGIISTFGRNPDGQTTTALKDVENHHGQLVADHLWTQKRLIPFPKKNHSTYGTIVSFIADTTKYQHQHSNTTDFSITPSGLIFEARNVPKDLTSKFRQRLFKHKGQYFAGVIINHSLKFIGQGSDGALRLTLQNAYFVETITKLIPIVKPHTHGQGIIVFKAIVYKNTPFFGLVYQ